MNLVFNEYIQFLKDKGLKPELKEGYYWLDNQIIKAFDTNGGIHKVLRVCVDDELNVTFKTYKHEDFVIETWSDTVNRYKERLLTLEKYSLDMLSEALELFNDRICAVPYSGGKDSSVVLFLIQQLVKNPLVIFNNTTIDVADTYTYVKKTENLLTTTADEGFYTWRKTIGFVPTRFGRACCSVFKEKAMIDSLNKEDKYIFFMGMRNDESSTRNGYTDYWKNHKWGNREWDACLPIRTWTETDIWLYILLKGIEINTKYKKGYSRVGCAIVCPFYAKSTWVLDQYWYPFLYTRWHEILDEDFVTNKKASILNCSNKEYHTCWNGGVYRDMAPIEVIEEFSEQQGLSIEISEKYFNRKCVCCGKKLKKDAIALSLKYNGRQTETFKCKVCLAKDLGIKTRELTDKIKDFKNDGCELF